MFACDPVTVVDQQIAAYRARDVEAFVAFYTPDAVLYDHPGSVVMTGRDEMRREYTRTFSASANMTLTIADRIVSGQYVIDKEAISDGVRHAEVVAIYHVNDCLIDRVDFTPVVMGGQ